MASEHNPVTVPQGVAFNWTDWLWPSFPNIGKETSSFARLWRTQSYWKCCSSMGKKNQQQDKQWHIHTMEYNSAIRNQHGRVSEPLCYAKGPFTKEHLRKQRGPVFMALCDGQLPQRRCPHGVCLYRCWEGQASKGHEGTLWWWDVLWILVEVWTTQVFAFIKTPQRYT